jgi:hypothetical protein
MNSKMKFGEDVQGYSIPVLNEREIRAAAGIIFVFMFTTILHVLYTGNFAPLKYAVTFFLIDIAARVFISPKYSPSLILGRFMVRNQTPEYVGAKQKKFAWIIGVLIAATMFVHLVVFNAFSPITGLLCFVCLIFLFFESAFGICIGCKVYSMVYREKAEYCPGEVCDVKSRHDIQRISFVQLLIVVSFIGAIFLTSYYFGDAFNKKPSELFAEIKPVQPK